MKREVQVVKRRIKTERRQASVLQAKTDPFFLTREWRSLISALVLKRGRQCEKCGRARNDDGEPIRVFGDHLVDVKDGGALLDETNIQLLCQSCHRSRANRKRAAKAAWQHSAEHAVAARGIVDNRPIDKILAMPVEQQSDLTMDDERRVGITQTAEEIRGLQASLDRQAANIQEIIQSLRTIEASIVEIKQRRWSPSRALPERDDAMVAAYKSGSAKTAAEKFGVSMNVIYDAIRRYETRTGEVIPKKPRGPSGARYRGKWNHVIERYRALRSAPAVATETGLSKQRVYQIIAEYKRSGKKLPEPLRYGERKPRVEWRCQGCGETRIVTEKRREHMPDLCRNCTFDQRRREQELPAEFDEIVENLKTGERGRWSKLSARWGFSRNAQHMATARVYGSLVKQKRIADIWAIWPDGVPQFLVKRFGAVNQRAL